MQVVNLIQQAEELGRLFFTNSEVKIILNTEVKTINDAILKGQLSTDAEIRKVIIQQAKSGSGEAQKLIENWKSRIKIENTFNENI